MNPFVKNGYLSPIASINSVYVDDIQSIELFRPTLIVEEILKQRELFSIKETMNQKDVLKQFNQLLISEFELIRIEANKIAETFGERLAKVIITLLNPSELSVLNRVDWTQKHWDYWKTIREIYFVGGLTSPLLTNIFFKKIQEALKLNGINDVHISFIEGSSHIGTEGLATLVDNGEYLLFDFGQTNIKRARILKAHGKIVVDTKLESIDSDYLFYKYYSGEELIRIADDLHDYIMSVISKTVEDTDFNGEIIHMAIANYINNGSIYSSRGGYGKLALIDENYESFLSKELSDRFKRKIFVKLHHDTSAMALIFKGKPNTAVISLGTAFGVAFT